MKRLLALAPLAVLFLVVPFSADAAIHPVSSGEIGIGQNGATVVAMSGSVVYARKGSNVQYWPGATLVPAAQATLPVPRCASATVKASGRTEELMLSQGASACTTGDAAVIAYIGSIVIYEPDVDLIRVDQSAENRWLIFLLELLVGI